MFSTLKESAVWTLLLFLRFFQIIWFFIIALSDWMKGFALVDKWFFTFFLTKVAVVLIGLLVTPFPLWVLIPLSFLPPPILMTVFFVTLIAVLAH